MPVIYLRHCLVRLLEGRSGIVCVLRFPWVIGRHPACDLCIDVPLLSRYHCRLFLREGEVWVKDLGSSNGTRLNGEPLVAPRPLRDGDRLLLACVPLEVRIPGPAELTPRPSGGEPRERQEGGER